MEIAMFSLLMTAADPTNPNWPSKVPNVPSGDHRGNNPPKK
jgi:hypothetical protein